MARVRRDECGLTLVECLVTVAIMGIAFVALLGGLGTSIFSSDVHRQQATAETVLRSFAEHVKTAPYVPCAPPAAYGTYAPSDDQFTAAIVSVERWDPATSAFDGACTTDSGLQRLTLQVAAANGRAVETLQIAKRTP